MKRRHALGAFSSAIAATLAGCSGDTDTSDSGSSDSTPQRRDSDDITTELEPGNVFNREYTLDERGRIEYDFLLRDGEDASVYVIDGGELSYALEGERFEYYSGGQDVSSHQDSVSLEPGTYYVVVTNSDAVVSNINFDLTVETYW